VEKYWWAPARRQDGVGVRFAHGRPGVGLIRDQAGEGIVKDLVKETKRRSRQLQQE
jgi:hypothetical protein